MEGDVSFRSYAFIGIVLFICSILVVKTFIWIGKKIFGFLRTHFGMKLFKNRPGSMGCTNLVVRRSRSGRGGKSREQNIQQRKKTVFKEEQRKKEQRQASPIIQKSQAAAESKEAEKFTDHLSLSTHTSSLLYTNALSQEKELPYVRMSKLVMSSKVREASAPQRGENTKSATESSGKENNRSRAKRRYQEEEPVMFHQKENKAEMTRQAAVLPKLPEKRHPNHTSKRVSKTTEESPRESMKRKNRDCLDLDDKQTHKVARASHTLRLSQSTDKGKLKVADTMEIKNDTEVPFETPPESTVVDAVSNGSIDELTNISEQVQAMDTTESDHKALLQNTQQTQQSSWNFFPVPGSPFLKTPSSSQATMEGIEVVQEQEPLFQLWHEEMDRPVASPFTELMGTRGPLAPTSRMVQDAKMPFLVVPDEKHMIQESGNHGIQPAVEPLAQPPVSMAVDDASMVVDYTSMVVDDVSNGSFDEMRAAHNGQKSSANPNTGEQVQAMDATESDHKALLQNTQQTQQSSRNFFPVPGSPFLKTPSSSQATMEGIEVVQEQEPLFQLWHEEMDRPVASPFTELMGTRGPLAPTSRMVQDAKMPFLVVPDEKHMIQESGDHGIQPAVEPLAQPPVSMAVDDASMVVDDVSNGSFDEMRAAHNGQKSAANPNTGEQVQAMDATESDHKALLQNTQQTQQSSRNFFPVPGSPFLKTTSSSQATMEGMEVEQEQESLFPQEHEEMVLDENPEFLKLSCAPTEDMNVDP